jgi:hypothetical protein
MPLRSAGSSASELASALAGLPTTTSPGCTSRVTTAPAPTSAPPPMRTPHRMTAPDRLDGCPVGRRLQAAVRPGRTWVLVVDEEDTVADEDLVFDPDPVADEGVALDLAAGSHDRTSLDLDERTNCGVAADPAAVEVRERHHHDLLAEVDVVDQTVRRVVPGPISHGRRSRESS